MPTGTRVDRIYQHLLSQGKDKGSAARIAQSVSGQALATGRPPRRRPAVKVKGHMRRMPQGKMEEHMEPMDNMMEEKGE